MSFQTLEAVATRAVVPRVDLLPAEFEDGRRSRRLRAALGLALAVVVAASGAGYAITVGHVGDAQDQLSREQARTSVLQAAQKPYAEVPAVRQQLQNAKKVQEAVTANDVSWYAYLDRVASTAPAGVSFSSTTFQLTPADGSSTGASVDPLTVSGIGTATFVGQTKAQTDVAAWLDAVVTIPGFTGAALTNSTYDQSTGLITFNASVTITSAALNAAK